MRIDLRPYLGSIVTVVIDRPLGSRHPSHPDLWYRVNYGYVIGTVAADGDPVDAYVLGIDEAVAEARGVVVGVVLRATDDEDELVVAPAGRHFSAVEIRSLVEFQERYFDSLIVTSDD